MAVRAACLPCIDGGLDRTFRRSSYFCDRLGQHSLSALVEGMQSMLVDSACHALEVIPSWGCKCLSIHTCSLVSVMLVLCGAAGCSWCGMLLVFSVRVLGRPTHKQAVVM